MVTKLPFFLLFRNRWK